MNTPEPIRRASEIEEVTNLYLIHPLSQRLVPIFARFGIRPNAVSLLGLACGVGAGVAYHSYHALPACVIGFLLMVGWHIMDGADGQLARLLNAQSEFGKIIDGICDYVTFISVYVGFGLALAPEYGASVWLLIIGAGICHALQAAAYEVKRQEYNFWGLDRRSAELPELAALQAQSLPSGLPQRLMTLLYRAYVAMQYRVSGVTIEFRQSLKARLERPSAAAEEVRRHYREAFAPSVRRWAVLSSNYRTIGLFVFAISGYPLGYFIFEIIGFNLILLFLALNQQRDYARFASTMPAQ